MASLCGVGLKKGRIAALQKIIKSTELFPQGIQALSCQGSYSKFPPHNPNQNLLQLKKRKTKQIKSNQK